MADSRVGKIIEGEFQLIDPATGAPLPKLPPPVPSPRQMTAEAKAQLAFGMAKFLAGELDEFRKWLHQTAERNPAEAARLYMEFAEFVAPRLKAANVNVNANTHDPGAPRRLTDMSMDELDGLLGH